MNNMDVDKVYYIVTPFGDKIMFSISKDKKEAYVKSIVPIPIDWRSMPHVLEYKIPIYPDETLGSILARVHKVISDYREEWKM